MKNYIHEVAELRKEMLADIEAYLKATNKTIFVEKGRLSYMAYNETEFQEKPDDFLNIVPEVEIAALTLDKHLEFIFVDVRGQEGSQGQLSTDELWAVCDYLLSAPKE